MTNEQLFEKFNPATAGQLSAEDMEIMHNLDDKQIDALADKFPNQPTRRSYLRLYDKSIPANKQLFQLSTWQNLRNVRKFSNRKNLIPWDFLTSATRFNQQTKPAASKAAPPKKVVVDLTAQEAAAELKNLVDKKTEVKKTTAPKQTPAAKKAAAKQVEPAKIVEAPVVSNGAQPDDQTFTNGE